MTSMAALADGLANALANVTCSGADALDVAVAVRFTRCVGTGELVGTCPIQE